MTDLERRRRIEDLCDAALARDVRERAAFVAAACGPDEALRHEVEALLAHAQTAERFLESPIGELAAHVLADDHHASLAGLQIGSYQILSLLGTGGMGDVYRARDTRLGRDVAIKVVANVFLSDPERLARFEREARVLATLNHPHIGAIYGLEEAGGVRGLVLELVEGATLAERLASGPLPVQEALSVARQIAEALEAAHEKGIIHRDLKPANIKITPDGTVKVLDFGLAKVFAREGSEYDVSAKPTITIEDTREGVIAGTAAYMSPEQARGKAVDKRTDIWAFGCVLYEMLTARPPFRGETVSDTIAGNPRTRGRLERAACGDDRSASDDCSNAVSRKIRSAVCATSATRASKSRRRLVPVFRRARRPPNARAIARRRLAVRADSRGGPRPVLGLLLIGGAGDVAAAALGVLLAESVGRREGHQIDRLRGRRASRGHLARREVRRFSLRPRWHLGRVGHPGWDRRGPQPHQRQSQGAAESRHSHGWLFSRRVAGHPVESRAEFHQRRSGRCRVGSADDGRADSALPEKHLRVGLVARRQTHRVPPAGRRRSAVRDRA